MAGAYVEWPCLGPFVLPSSYKGRVHNFDLVNAKSTGKSRSPYTECSR
jgi:hypothetical protein